MMNYGKMVIVGNSIAELEQDLEMLKVTLKSGKMCAVGGSSVAEVENGLAMMKEMMGATPNRPHKCNCDCGGVCEECECEDPEDLEEEEDEEDLEEEELEPQAITGRMLVELLHRWEQEMK